MTDLISSRKDRITIVDYSYQSEWIKQLCSKRNKHFKTCLEWEIWKSFPFLAFDTYTWFILVSIQVEKMKERLGVAAT